ncbi:MAG: hypothetical protein K0Q72_197 [Armatimonadetes bacterium]|jgi:hypothetical protein|nr:hypothetical protein [Armatimonadota bacterium]
MNGWSISILASGIGATVVSAAPAPKKPAAKPALVKTAAKPAAPMAFKPLELDLAPGETYPVELFVPSPTGKTFTGTPAFEVDRAVTVAADPRWKGTVPGWGTKTYPKLTASREAAGEYSLHTTIGEGDKAARAVLKVRIVEPKIELVPGVFKLLVKVTNPFQTRLLNGKLSISNPDRFLQDVTTAEFKVAPGQTQELEIPLPGAAPVCGETYDFTTVVETYQGYKRKTTTALAFPPHT